MTADYYRPGDWNAVCNRCGRKKKASTLRLVWTGEYVCPEHWERRHPQDFVRTPPDEQTPPWTQPMPAPIFAYFCSPEGMTAIAGYAVAGCAIAGYISPLFSALGAPIVCPVGGESAVVGDGVVGCIVVE